MRWPWSKRATELPKGITVLDVRGAQVIIVRTSLPGSRLAELKHHLEDVLAQTVLRDVPVCVLSEAIQVSVLTDRSAA